MADRSEYIKGRVLRNLVNNGFSTSEVQDEEIYDELTLGQDHIISEACDDKIITITLEEDTDTYALSTDTKTVTRKNIASVKVSKVPDTWRGPFVVIPNKEFAEIVNNVNLADVDWTEAFTNWGWDEFDFDISSIKTTQPLIGTIINNQLKIYPTPNENYDGDEIDLYTYLSSSAGVIDKDNNPDIKNMWDKALELYATYQFLSGPKRTQFMNEFKAEIIRLKPIQNRKHHNLNRPAVW